VEILTAARQKSSPNAKRAAIELALATAYGRLEQYERLLDVASGLLKAAPKSDAMFQMTLLAHLRLQRWNEAGSVIAARLALVPDDPIALRAQAELAEAQGRFDLAVGHYRRVTSTSRAEAGDWNNLAWDALFLEALPADAVAQAQKAATQSQNRLPGILHTLAAVLAASGHAGEARSLMLQVMEMQGLEEPGPGIWLLAGMIAEEYGEREAAIAAYGRVKPQKGEEHMQNSSFQLARRRLLRLGVQ
jgi:tetratricopeptide (TPR) repeat protein